MNLTGIWTSTRQNSHSPTRTVNPAHRNMASKIFHYKAKNDKVWDKLSDDEKKQCARKLRQMRSEQRSLPPHSVQETSYKVIQYVRYADDFIVGVIGSRRDAENAETRPDYFPQRKTGAYPVCWQKTEIHEYVKQRTIPWLRYIRITQPGRQAVVKMGNGSGCIPALSNSACPTRSGRRSCWNMVQSASVRINRVKNDGKPCQEGNS